MIDLAGQKFGRLTALREVERAGAARRWECKCNCGTIGVFRQGNLRNGHSKSCGCLQVENGQRVGRTDKRRHGCAVKGAVTAEYRAWRNMISRCYDPGATGFYRYGGRGIAVCDRWLNGAGSLAGFECFLADLGLRPSPAHSIDRYPNNDGNYEPDNVRWATRREQQNNMASNRTVTVAGATMTIAQAARQLGIKISIVRSRIHRGASPEDALSSTRR